MKKIMLSIISIIAMSVFSGCIGRMEYKDFNMVESEYEIVNDMEINITYKCYGVRFYMFGIMKMTDRFNDFDYLYIDSNKSEYQKKLIINWYDVKINNELQIPGKMGQQTDYMGYVEKEGKYYFSGFIGPYLLSSYESNTKDKDKITVTMNITVITNEKEETKTIERNFITKERKVFALYSL
jgi:hypothetical protein